MSSIPRISCVPAVSVFVMRLLFLMAFLQPCLSFGASRVGQAVSSTFPTECIQNKGDQDCRTAVLTGGVIYDSLVEKWSATPGGGQKPYTSCHYTTCNSEEEAYAAVIDQLDAMFCPGYVVTPNGDWAQTRSEFGIVVYQTKTYDVALNNGNTDCHQNNKPNTNYWSFYLTSKVSVRCPLGYNPGPYESSNVLDGAGNYRNTYCARLPRDCCVPLGNPIDVGSGAKILKEQDVSLGATSLLSFTRFYSSQSTNYNADFGVATPNALGRNWRHSFQRRIFVHYGQSSSVAVRVADNGYRTFFSSNGSGGWNAPPHLSKTLISLTSSELPAKWRYTEDDGSIELFDSEGKLLKLESPNGKFITFSYSGDLLMQLEDESERKITLTYSSDGSLFGLATSWGEAVEYSYDNSRRLTFAGRPSGPKKQYKYMETGTDAPGWYAAASNDLITSVVDELGVEYISVGYDNYGYATSTQLAGGVNRFELVDQQYWTRFSDISIGYRYPGSTGDSRVVFERRGGYLRLISLAPTGGKIKLDGVASLGYSATGLLSYSDDYLATRKCYFYNDVDKRLVMEVVGVPSAADCQQFSGSNSVIPPGAVKITKNWYSARGLVERAAQPNLITSYIYNGRPDIFNNNIIASCEASGARLSDGSNLGLLCKKVEQTTTDNDGHLGFGASLQAGMASRIQQWTYNSRGQVLTSSLSRAGVTTTTTYNYYSDSSSDHRKGDLQSVTDSLGYITKFDKYNGAGKIIQSTDSNGVVSINSYDGMQRILTADIGGRVTKYSYDAVGQLTKVEQPDGGWVGYEYDAARRLVAMKNNRGERVEYELDGAGNRVTTAVKDGTGAIGRQLSSQFDTMGRVLQAVGAR